MTSQDGLRNLKIMETYYIYRYIEKKTGKTVYVGQSVNVKQRHRGHRNGDKSFDIYLQKLGEESFKLDILGECEGIVETQKMENYYIKKYNTLHPYGYNMCLSNGGRNKETRRKISIKQKERFQDAKKKEEVVDRLSKRYIVTTPEGDKIKIKNLAKFCRENVDGLEPGCMTRVAQGHLKHSKGYVLDYEDETLRIKAQEKRSKIRKKKRQHKGNYKFINPEGENFEVKNFVNFCRENGLWHGCMILVAQGKRKQHKGWKAEYA